MRGHGGDYKDLVVFLAAAGVIVPLVNRLTVSYTHLTLPTKA